METLQLLGVALGLATLAGINLYLTVFVSGLAIQQGWITLLPQYEQLSVLADPLIVGISGTLFVLEFFADKVPWVDSLWDAVHTFIRPVGVVLLGLAALGEMPTYLQVTAALIAGGAALTTHVAKAGTRLLANHSPEPVSNIVLSVAEDATVVDNGEYVAIFNSIHRVMKAEKTLKELRLPILLIPAPRALASDCGLAIRYAASDREAVEQALAAAGLTPEEIYVKQGEEYARIPEVS